MKPSLAPLPPCHSTLLGMAILAVKWARWYLHTIQVQIVENRATCNPFSKSAAYPSRCSSVTECLYGSVAALLEGPVVWLWRLVDCGKALSVRARGVKA